MESVVSDARLPLAILHTVGDDVQKTDEGFVEFRLDRAEAKPAPQGVIYDGQRAVGRVHAAYQINVLGYKETFVILVAVGQLYGVLLLAFVGSGREAVSKTSMTRTE